MTKTRELLEGTKKKHIVPKKGVIYLLSWQINDLFTKKVTEKKWASDQTWRVIVDPTTGTAACWKKERIKLSCKWNQLQGKCKLLYISDTWLEVAMKFLIRSEQHIQNSLFSGKNGSGSNLWWSAPVASICSLKNGGCEFNQVNWKMKAVFWYWTSAPR